MLRRRNLLTTLLIILPWALLLTLWHQNPTSRYLTLLRKEIGDNSTVKPLFNNVTQSKDDSLQCVNQYPTRETPVVVRTYVYSRPPPWNEDLPVIYVITPTYTRPVQKAELVRLANTFLHVVNLHWIVVEDCPRKTKLVANLLEKAGLNFTHLNIESPHNQKVGLSRTPEVTPRGTVQRNLGLRWLRDNLNASNPPEGVVYFADDDNTYSLEVFEEMRYTRTVSVWPVAFVGGLRPYANFKLEGVKGGYQETSLLKDLVTMDGLEAKAANCTKVLVWHTRTERPTLVNEGKRGFTDMNIEV